MFHDNDFKIKEQASLQQWRISKAIGWRSLFNSLGYKQHNNHVMAKQFSRIRDFSEHLVDGYYIHHLEGVER